MPVYPEAILKRYKALLAQRSNWDNVLQDIADYVVPHKSNIMSLRADGAKQTERLFDATAIEAAKMLAGSLWSFLTPSTQPWISLVMRQDDLNQVKTITDWLEDCSRRMHKALKQSVFNTASHETYHDLVTFGTGVMFIEEKTPKGDGAFAGLRVRAHPWSEYVLGENGDGQVDTIMRTIKLARRAAVSTWPASVSETLRTAARDRPDDKIEILHAVYPRDDAQPDKAGGKQMPWASCYLEMETKKILDEGGYPEFPFVCPRWDKTSGETYGRGPSHTAIPDIRSLNSFKEFTLKALPLAIQPPTIERDDSEFGELDRTPGGRNVAQGAGPIKDQIGLLETGFKADLATEFFALLQDSIRRMYFTQHLVLRDRPNMTATEINALREEMLRMLGPTGGRLESEFLHPLVGRIFAIMLRQGAFLPIPQELTDADADADVDVQYEGPLARAQRGIEIAAQDQTILFATGVSQALAAVGDMHRAVEVWDPLDLDTMLRERGAIAGLPSDAMRSKEDVQTMRDARGAAAQKQQQMDQITKIAESVGKAGPGLKAVSDAGRRAA